MTSFFNFLEQNRGFSYYSIVLTISLIIFLVCWLKEPRRLINGVFFTIFLLLFAGWVTILVFSTNLKTLRMAYGAIVLLFFSSSF